MEIGTTHPRLPTSPACHAVETHAEAQPLLILGASPRAAAQSALRAGLQPIAAGRFIDVDLQAAADVLSVTRYPDDLPRAAEKAPAAPWMYTGGLENRPGLVEAVSSTRPLWGNPPDVLRVVRDPFTVRRLLASADLPALSLRPPDAPPPPDGRWMLKPRHGTGGGGIRCWTPPARNCATRRTAHYFQQRAHGTPLAALFLAEAGTARLIGVCRQLIGLTTLNAPEFSYCGSIGPIALDPALESILRCTGEVLARHCRLRGLFGCDFLCDGRSAWLTEVNPRYTASVEILEHAFDMSLIDWHGRACEASGETAPSRTIAEDFDRLATQVAPQRHRQVAGKMVLYAPQDFTAPCLASLRNEEQTDGLPFLADIPPPGTFIRRREPICTVLATATCIEDCNDRLATRTRRVESRLFGDGIRDGA